MRTGFEAMRLGAIAFVVPFLFVGEPSLLLMGSPELIVANITTAIIGCVILAAVVEGFLVAHFSVPERIAGFVIGALLLIPQNLIQDYIPNYPVDTTSPICCICSIKRGFGYD